LSAVSKAGERDLHQKGGERIELDKLDSSPA
jgi:hypothetical protein